MVKELPHDYYARNCWFLTGPTASGKTSIGVQLAKALNAEIISMDSMALYRGMNLGTAKPSAEEIAGVPHHLLDIRDPTEEFSVADYLEAVRSVVLEIRERNHPVLFVGGTPLYLKALLRGMNQGPPPNAKLRKELRIGLEQNSVHWLHEQLQRVDPITAARLHPNDTKRIIRALEVYRISGTPISQSQGTFAQSLPAEQCQVFVLNPLRVKLHQRIETRTEQMFAQGLVQEVRELLGKYGSLGKTAGQAVGYREVLVYLAGNSELTETIQQVKTSTRRLAKRQCTWFRSLGECRFISLSEQSDKSKVVQSMLQMAHQTSQHFSK